MEGRGFESQRQTEEAFCQESPQLAAPYFTDHFHIPVLNKSNLTHFHARDVCYLGGKKPS